MKFKTLLFVDSVIGRHDAESLVEAARDDVLTHLITTDTVQGRNDFGDCLKRRLSHNVQNMDSVLAET